MDITAINWKELNPATRIIIIIARATIVIILKVGLY
jgi:hypothetical protein